MVLVIGCREIEIGCRKENERKEKKEEGEERRKREEEEETGEGRMKNRGDPAKRGGAADLHI